MDGVIRRREVFTFARLIVREFGVGAWLRCVWACLPGSRATFLDIIWEKQT